MSLTNTIVTWILPVLLFCFHFGFWISRCLSLDEEKRALERGKEFVKSILKDYETIPGEQGMKVLKGVIDIETGGEKRDIIIRKITEPFWKSCRQIVDEDDSRNRVAAIGSPGIGKTFTTPILIRMLLENQNRCTVVYLKRSEEKNDWYFEFVKN